MNQSMTVTKMASSSMANFSSFSSRRELSQQNIPPLIRSSFGTPLSTGHRNYHRLSLVSEQDGVKSLPSDVFPRFTLSSRHRMRLSSRVVNISHLVITFLERELFIQNYPTSKSVARFHRMVEFSAYYRKS